MRELFQNESDAAERDVFFVMRSEDDNYTLLTGLSLSVQIVKAGGSSYAAIAGSASEIGGGTYKASLDQTDLDTLGEAMLQVSASGAVTQYVPLLVKVGPSVNVTLGAIQSSRDPGNRTSSPITLEMFQNEGKTFSLTVQDANGDSVDLSSKTLRFVVIDSQDPATAQFDVDEGANLTVSGTNNEIANVTVSASQAATATREWLWRLWDIDGDGEVLLHGAFLIKPALQVA